ncbi:MAG: TetR/AcrR family transcriptional regulator [Mycobacterium sp.]|nr:TetR/AcrR family transcriptional regulator [Mycobacterium sp.]
MPRQARAEATRWRIIDSAVELFAELGYGETGLADVLQRAGVSKGAFYYHFESKEAIAAAIIDEYSRKLITAAGECLDPDAPRLEGIIRASFRSAEIIETDPVARVGNDLLQALSQISSISARVYREWSDAYLDILTRSIGVWRPRNGVDSAEAADAIWSSVLGSHLISSAGVEDRYAQLARTWRFFLSALAPADEREELTKTLAEITSGYPAVVGASR